MGKLTVGAIDLEWERLQGVLWIVKATIKESGGENSYVYTLTALTEAGARMKSLQLLPGVIKKVDG